MYLPAEDSEAVDWVDLDSMTAHLNNGQTADIKYLFNAWGVMCEAEDDPCFILAADASGIWFAEVGETH